MNKRKARMIREAIYRAYAHWNALQSDNYLALWEMNPYILPTKRESYRRTCITIVRKDFADTASTLRKAEQSLTDCDRRVEAARDEQARLGL